MLITLTTDFGTQDAYVAIMKGVMARIAPAARFVDITHAVPPQDVRHAAYTLWAALPYFPPDSVHLVVVDPGVGTTRHALAAQTPWGMLVGPDNGVFSYVWADAPPSTVVALQNPAYRLDAISTTFHGRDIFAPTAAHIANGVPLDDLGPRIPNPVRFSTPPLTVTQTQLRGTIITVDHFGNAITSIGRLVWEEKALCLDAAFHDLPRVCLNPANTNVQVARRSFGPIRRTYGQTAPSEVLALVGSTGMLEIAINQDNAAHILDLRVRDEVTVDLKST